MKYFTKMSHFAVIELDLNIQYHHEFFGIWITETYFSGIFIGNSTFSWQISSMPLRATTLFRSMRMTYAKSCFARDHFLWHVYALALIFFFKCGKYHRNKVSVSEANEDIVLNRFLYMIMVMHSNVFNLSGTQSFRHAVYHLHSVTKTLLLG